MAREGAIEYRDALQLLRSSGLRFELDSSFGFKYIRFEKYSALIFNKTGSYAGSDFTKKIKSITTAEKSRSADFFVDNKTER